MKARQSLALVTAWSMILGTALIQYSVYRKEILEYESRLNEIGTILDVDSNGSTSMREWSIAYEELNIPFNPRHPRGLSLTNLERFYSRLIMDDRDVRYQGRLMRNE